MITSWARGALLVALVVGCAPAETRLIVDVRTDLLPETEFDEVVTRVRGGPTTTLTVDPSVDFLGGARVAELEPVSTGTVTLDVELRRAGTLVLSRPLVVQLGGATAVTIVIGRACRDVSCPDAGSPTATACSAGRCVDPECSDLAPEACGEPACVAHVDCPAPAAPCASALCAQGECLVATDDTTCGAGQICDPDAGCVDVLDPIFSCGGTPGTCNRCGCSPGSGCCLACADTDFCRMSCTDGDCTLLRGVHPLELHLNCFGASTCQGDARAVRTVGMECNDTSDCTMDCRGSTTCAVVCNSVCRAYCPASGCDWTCESGATTCADGSEVCNRACP